MRVKQDIISSKVSDFQIGERTFEIGGKSKGQQQIAKAQEGYVIKMILRPDMEILFHFGISE